MYWLCCVWTQCTLWYSKFRFRKCVSEFYSKQEFNFEWWCDCRNGNHHILGIFFISPSLSRSLVSKSNRNTRTEQRRMCLESMKRYWLRTWNISDAASPTELNVMKICSHRMNAVTYWLTMPTHCAHFDLSIFPFIDNDASPAIGAETRDDRHTHSNKIQELLVCLLFRVNATRRIFQQLQCVLRLDIYIWAVCAVCGGQVGARFVVIFHLLCIKRACARARRSSLVCKPLI